MVVGVGRVNGPWKSLELGIGGGPQSSDVGGCRTELDVGGGCGSWVSKVANGVGRWRLLPELVVGGRVEN